MMKYYVNFFENNQIQQFSLTGEKEVHHRQPSVVATYYYIILIYQY
jgi:hypothetical protein